MEEEFSMEKAVEEPEAAPEIPEETPEESEDDQTITFTLKKHHIYAGLIPIAFILGIVTGFIFWGQEESPAQASAGGQTVQNSEDVRRYDVPIAANDPVKGPADAPVTIIEFSDFECPFCRRYFTQTLPRLLSNYPDQIRYVFKDFPLTSIHPNAFPAAEAAQCAHEQGAFWEFHDLLFEMELELGRSTYEQYAEDLGLDVDAFTECLDERRYSDAVQADFDFAAGLGVRSTPTFFINGLAVVGAQPYEVFAEVIEGELEQAE